MSSFIQFSSSLEAYLDVAITRFSFPIQDIPSCLLWDSYQLSFVGDPRSNIFRLYNEPINVAGF